jgi:hypothetical protein
MSRSKKKNPVVSIACCGKGESIKAYKKHANAVVKNSLEDIPSGSFYRKLNDRNSWPDDGKQRRDNEKAYRK